MAGTNHDIFSAVGKKQLFSPIKKSKVNYFHLQKTTVNISILIEIIST
ncbi:hypothetical protein IMCC1989_2233 [gamma proteobacterium IMCC1989]|nr:hypothetical protein IMCC1989_2233 [gamma proteobacterium IMCC1989]